MASMVLILLLPFMVAAAPKNQAIHEIMKFIFLKSKFVRKSQTLIADEPPRNHEIYDIMMIPLEANISFFQFHNICCAPKLVFVWQALI